MRRNQSAEDYLETILLLSQQLEDVHQIEIARKMNVSQPAVQKALRILKEKEYVCVNGLHICLTPQGKDYAQKIYNRHCIIRQFLILHGVEYDIANEDACELEHCISDQTFLAMERFVKEN